VRTTLALIVAASLLVAACSASATTTPADESLEPVPQAVQAPPSQVPSGEVAGPVNANATPAEPATGTAESPAGETIAADATAGADGRTETPDAGPSVTPDPTLQALAENFQFPTRGNPNAPLTIYEFSDFL
jgi:protein-disulfide isomerase